MSRRDLLLWLGSFLLLAVAVARLTVQDRPPRLRRLSVEAAEVPGGAVAPGQTATWEAHWSPPDDAYVLGFSPSVDAPAGASLAAELMLYEGAAKATLFLVLRRMGPASAGGESRPMLLPAGTGYLLRKGGRLTFRCSVTNHGAASVETRGARALVYFVPVEGH
jgi:hypothetical protein